jgi:hypothetical protein
MKDSPNEKKVPAVRAAFSFVGVAAILLFAFLLMMAGGAGLVEVPIYLVFGWITFLARTIPKISVNVDMLAFSAVCLTATLLFANYFLIWIVNAIATARGAQLKWRWKWTCAGFTAVSLLFLVGMSVIGLVHQLGWLATTTDPMYTRLGISVIQNQIPMRNVTTLVRSGGYRTIEQFKTELFQQRIYFDNSTPNAIAERFHILVITSPSNEVTGVLIFPRDPKARERFGGMMALDDDDYPIKPGDLSKTIKTNQNRMISLF